MFLSAFSSLPLLAPPFTSILSTRDGSGSVNPHEPSANGQNSQRRINTHQPHPLSPGKPNSLHDLWHDECAIASRKIAISTYGYSWLRPAGVAKTMLGRREEEAEREELDRQMREQEEMELEMERGEELARQARLRDQHQNLNGLEEMTQRDLDDDIPDADEGRGQGEIDDEEGAGDLDLDDEIPDADEDDLLAEESDNVEGETGITDDVDHTDLGHDNDPPPRPPAHTMPPPGNRGPQMTNAEQARLQAMHQTYTRRWGQGPEPSEQEALANAMADEDEQRLADPDRDAEIPYDEQSGIDGRNLDDEIPEAEEEVGDGEWQHTDTEVEDESAMALMEDEGDVSMEMSVIGGRRSVAAAAAAAIARSSMLATPATEEGSSMLHTPDLGGTGSVGRTWLGRTSLSGAGRTGNLFAGIMGMGAAGSSPQAPTQIQPQVDMRFAEQGRQQQPRRSSGRRGMGRENRSARESLD